MRIAYVDSSCLVAVAFQEPGWDGVAERLGGYDVLISSNLLEAELESACVREGVTGSGDLLTWISWVLPDRRISAEMRTVLQAGYVRGADLWHLGCALYVAGDPSELPFLTLDEPQARVARQMGFPTTP